MLHVWRTPGRHADLTSSRRTPFPTFRIPADKIPRLGLSRVVRVYRPSPNPIGHRSSDALPNPNPNPSPTPPDSQVLSSPPSSPTEETHRQHTMNTDNLNDIPMELRPLTPFLQRAQELKLKDPTMSYWCTYYAVQQGVHLKPRDKQSRNYLMKLMAPLETIRSDINSTVVTNNDTACVYIEDFALRVFDAADNEDRRGDASRGTAKKFLAAANFLELLKVFEDDAEPSSSANKTSSAFSQHKEKIRYAKWKAADIAKAFREGRKPSPGPAHAPASVTSPGLDGLGPTNGNSPIGFPFESHLSAPGALYKRVGSPTNNSSNTVSPQPGGSRNQSVSPAQRHTVLPFTSASEQRRDSTGLSGLSGLSNGSTYVSAIRMNGVQSEATSPTTMNPPRPIGHARGRSVSQTQTQAPDLTGYNRPPPPPKDVLTPNRPSIGTQPLPNSVPSTPAHQTNLYVTPAGKSPGAWSTAATPGGYEVRNGGTPTGSGSFAEHQSSPSRVPDRMSATMSKQAADTDTSSYPPHPYPAVKLSPPTRPSIPGQKDSFASNAATAGGAASRQISFASTPSYQTSADSSTATEGYYTNKLAQEKAAEASNRALEAAENDELGPLVDGRPSQKRVRWTASVVGGSTAGSESPGNSPKSPVRSLPALPESSDSNSSSGGDIKFAGGVKPGKAAVNGAEGSPPTSLDEFQQPSNKKAAPPPVPKKPHSTNPPFIPPPQAPYASYTPGPNATSLPSSNSSPSLSSTHRLAKNSPRNSPRNSPKTRPSDLPTPGGTPNGSGFVTQSSAPPSAPSTSSPSGTSSTLPARPRRLSTSSPTPLSNGSQPAIKPFVPLFGAGPGGLPTPTSSAFSISDRNSPRVSPTPPGSSGTPTQVPSRTLSPVDNRVLPTSLPFRQITAAKKHSKYATSALEFDDLETARAELLAALAILNGEKIE
ncbi:hypothetical protein FRB95_001016 [Tulasnella sp. JGI-2019a]|nr:hypothetical protein FRB95_001016 [Tulasnella sp. JGI-2019a]